jgi:tetraacyldisaccharide 4'-kinase
MRRRKIKIENILLFPFSLLYGAAVGMRNLFFEWGFLPVAEFRLPVISVGNITVGGTGKTPHIEYLVELLKEECNLATLSRGYKRKTRHFIIAETTSSASQIGDEPRQLKQKFPDLTVAVDRNRVNGIRKLMQLKEQVDVVLLDDAFQHRYVKPGKSILLIDYHRPVTEDLLLPAGRLREPAVARHRADIILITKSPGRLKPIEMRNMAKRLGLGFHQNLYFTAIEYDRIRPVFEISEVRDEQFFKEKKVPVLLLTGIANPRALRTFARRISTRLHEIRFPDHHRFTARDIDKISARFAATNDPDTLILTTEKDAMRLQESALPENLINNIYYVPIRVVFLNNDQDEFNQIIRNYVRSNKRNNILHKKSDPASA